MLCVIFLHVFQISCHFQDAAVNASDYLFTDTSCETQFTALPIIIMVLYISVYSLGKFLRLKASYFQIAEEAQSSF